MIDWNRVIEHVRMGTAPASWHVVRAKISFFVWSAIGGVVLAIAAAAGEAYLLASNTVVGYGLTDSTPDGILNVWHAVDLAAAIVFAIAGIVFAILRVREMGKLDEQMFVLLPEGFVLRRGDGPKGTQAYNYPNIRTISRQVRNGTVYLIMQAGDGRNMRIQIDGRFGKPKAIAQQIQNAHAQYTTAMVRSRPIPPQR